MKKNTYLNSFLHLSVWIALHLFFVTNVKTVGVIKQTHAHFQLAIFISSLCNAGLFYTISLYLLPKMTLGYSIRKTVWLSVLLWVLFSLVETIIDFSFFVNFYSTHDQDYAGQLFSNSIVNLFVITMGASYGLLRIWKKSEKQKEDLNRETLKAELDFLKAQVNPHFLFNVLNMAYSSANKNNDTETAGIIEELANMMRYMLYESNVNKIALEKEIEYLQSFVNLQKKRLSTEVLPNIAFSIEGAIKKHQIAPLLLIPFVENAFKHGIRMGNETFIIIRLEVTDQALWFEVKNSISKNSNELETQYGGVGLENVKKRLELLYPNQYELSITEEEKQFKVILKLNM
ncbi:sensor histidine kinase [Flavobacterium sedimenticola]|uniref:Histidine kinase n=1 Tax=Flavobacterium sedimenticola TaxID=3043286 RepID=A0ABT6XST1_9FLAO|nr:histidine kinase [Flavobacterium sedimenticola]MDI9258159.1 histidine kinase [Flavobacterium sedimenticola]